MPIDLSQEAREVRLLREGRERVLEQVMKAEKSGKVGALPYQNYLVRQALTDLAARIEVDSLRKPAKGTRGATHTAYKKFAMYLGSLDSKIVALRAIQAALGMMFETGAADDPQPIGKKLAGAIGRAVYAEYLMTHFKEASPPLFNSLVREYSRSMTSDERHLLKSFKAKFDAAGFTWPTWNRGDTEHVGNYLIQQLRALAFVEVWNRTERKNGRANVVQYIRLAEDLRSASLELVNEISKTPAVAAALIEPPKDWDAETNTGGGFHTTDMQRQLAYAVQRNGQKRVSAVVVGTLNTLQQVAWKINGPVLDAVRAVAMTRDIGKIVAAHTGPAPDFPGEESGDDEKRLWKQAMREHYTEKKTRRVHHMKAQKAFTEAAELRQYPAIWFAYYADSRGRKYARAGSVSPQGNDLEKGLITFAKGEPLDSPEAEKWFKLHGANRYGIDKVDLDERLKWVKDNHDLIVRIGTAPEHHQEWIDADSPVQFLAWAIEYAAWVRDPDQFLSYLPIAQDGTCNGLQNYSALLHDSVGGAAVNLTPSPAPRDIYADVARRVTEILEGMPPSKFRDAWLKHQIGRKVTKRTTMTLPYGCTRFACSEFIVSDYLEQVHPPEIAMADYGEAANFLSHVVWQAIGDVVIKAREGMEWLKGWASHAVKNGKRVSWVAPNGLRVVSEYEAMKKVTVKSVAFNTRIMLREPTDKVDGRKTANAVAPNFIHSMDAAHLDFVVFEAGAERGFSIAAIHDDYGTHAKHTAELHRIIRKTFVDIYLEPTMLQQMAQATGYEVPPPSLGDLDVRQVLESIYFFA